jgi:putative hydrolase of HD superfamily
MSKRDIDFLFEAGSLRHLPRAWQQVLGMPVSNVMEHTLRVLLIALVIAREEGVKDEEKIMKIALLHDLSEARTMDIAFIHRGYTSRDEEKARHDMFEGTVFERELPLLKEYEERESVESKIVKDADTIEVDIELRELAKVGSTTAAKWQEGRKTIRDTKLFTDTARKMWDEL